MAVRVVTDSTADIPQDLVKELGISVVPLTVQFGDKSFLDGVEITPDQFFQWLIESPQLPTTSQPSPGAFLDVYRGLLEAEHQVVSIHISDKLSGTLNSVRQAKEQLGDVPLEVIDSRQAAISLGLVVIAAARAAKDGASYEETQSVARQALGQVQLFALLDTLEFLRKGGRIGKVRGFIGALLHVRPIITVTDGEVQSVISVRSRDQGIRYMLTLVEERSPLIQAAVFHSTTPDEAEEVAGQLRPMVSDGNVIIGRIGPVIGTHVGPGTVGVVIQSEKSGESES
jgi:DegV family protein with EDD domain